MGSCAAPSAKGDDKFITTDYLQQCHKKITTITGASFLYSGHTPRTYKFLNQQYNKTVNNIIMINA
ncbi:hypothetical protein E5H78_25100 [Escherichia coli]|nr:hypothetical protein [Escherichia coli]